MAQRGYTDIPVATRADDSLGVQDYVDALADFVLECETPMTIAIQGDWGSGKTSIMNMVREQVESHVVPIWFNTWQYSQFEMGEQLPLTLLTALLEQLGGDTGPAKAISRVVGGLRKVVTTMVLEKTVGGVNAERMTDNADVMDLAKQIVALRLSLDAAVKQSLAKDPRRTKVVVFVDDLDRLPPAKAVELLEIVKLFLDLRSCVFLLAVDYSIVTHGIRAKYGAFVDENKGRSFFDKLIQLPFVVPINQYRVETYISKLIGSMGAGSGEGEARLYQSMVETSVGFNPRSLKRLFNAFQLTCKVAVKRGIFAGPPEKELASRRSLFGALCLQMAFEKPYEALLRMVNDVSADFIEGMCDAEKLASEERYATLRAAAGDSLARFGEFWEVFFQSLQTDDERGRLSSSEMVLFRSVLGFSAITSSLDSDSITRQKRPRRRDDFLKECAANPALHLYYSTLFDHLEKKGFLDAHTYFGTRGFSVKKTVRCYPPGVGKELEIDAERLNSNARACEICRLFPKDIGDRKYVSLRQKDVPIEQLIALIDQLS